MTKEQLENAKKIIEADNQITQINRLLKSNEILLGERMSFGFKIIKCGYQPDTKVIKEMLEREKERLDGYIKFLMGKDEM